MVSTVCKTEVIVSGVDAIDEALVGKACQKCVDLMIDDLIEDEPLDQALARGYEPAVLVDDPEPDTPGAVCPQ